MTFKLLVLRQCGYKRDTKRVEHVNLIKNKNPRDTFQ